MDYDLNLEEYEFSLRTSTAIYNNGIETLYDLLKYSERDLLSLKNFGKKSLTEVKEFIEEHGYKLGQFHNSSVVPRIEKSCDDAWEKNGERK